MWIVFDEHAIDTGVRTSTNFVLVRASVSIALLYLRHPTALPATSPVPMYARP